MKRKKSAFKESLLSVPLGYTSNADWRYARPNSNVIMFEVDVTTCIALFLTNILHSIVISNVYKWSTTLY